MCGGGGANVWKKVATGRWGCSLNTLLILSHIVWKKSKSFLIVVQLFFDILQKKYFIKK
jgi:hypothetical protein